MSAISKKVAQKLVDYVMQIVPYNINIIDKRGIVIASGHPERIGHVHKAGLTAIQNNRLEIVYTNENGMKPGVNLPIHDNGEICGVVGISGAVENVMSIANLIKCMIELLLEHEASLDTKQVSNLMRTQFLFEWLNLSTQPSDEFIRRGHQYQIAIDQNHVAAVLTTPSDAEAETAFARLEASFDKERLDRFVLRVNVKQCVVIMEPSQNLREQIRQLCEIAPPIRVGVGLPDQTLNYSFRQATSALRIGQLLRPEERIHDYQDYCCFDAVIVGAEKRHMQEELCVPLQGLLQEKNNALLETLLSYFRNNGEYAKTAEQLHIHRNTLDYRLQKIHQLSGLNPRSHMDLFRLICGYIICYYPKE